MYNYYSKIFFSKNSPKSFNVSLIFPFFSIMTSVISMIIIFSTMNTIENKITDKIIAVTGYSRIYQSNALDNDIDNQFDAISSFLEKNGRNVSRSINRVGVLFHRGNNKVINVFGLSDISVLNENLDIHPKISNGLQNKILIGEDLSKYLELNHYNEDFKELDQVGTIFAPIESKVFLNSINLEFFDQKFNFFNINALDKVSDNYVFIDYHDAKKLFSGQGEYLSIDSVLSSEEINYINENFKSVRYEEWKDQYPLFFTAMSIEKYLYTFFGAILIFLASFNLYGLINLIIFRKEKQLAMLIYLGIGLSDMKKIFTYSILKMGFVASIMGVIFSYLIVELQILNKFVPLVDSINIPFLIVPFSIIFNLITLYISTVLSIRKKIINIEGLKLNAIGN